MEKELIEKLRQPYMQNSPEGMTPKDIRNMSDIFFSQECAFSGAFFVE